MAAISFCSYFAWSTCANPPSDLPSQKNTHVRLFTFFFSFFPIALKKNFSK